MIPDPEAQRRVLNRLRRARGQLDALIGAVDNGAPCRAVLTQLAAVSTALDRAGFAIVAAAMKDCLADPPPADAGEDGLTTAELERLFLSLA
jgi:DNA-binding FrmR family transcriptional regulator